MATLISTTNVALSELNTAPGGSTYSDMRFQNLARPGWNEGPLGSNAFTNYTWGLNGNSSGADAIYGLTPTSGQFSLNQFKGLQYYFDGSTFNIKDRWQNNLIPPPPPQPPSANDISIEVVLTDSTLNYSIFGGPNTPPNFQWAINMPAGTSQASTQIPGFMTDTYPLVREVFWIIRVNTDAINFGGGTLTFTINSTQVLNTGLAPGQNDFDWTTTSTIAYTDGSGILLDFEVN
jgi:hypothetical protein